MPAKPSKMQYDYARVLTSMLEIHLNILIEKNNEYVKRYNKENYYAFTDAAEEVRDHWKLLKAEMSRLNQHKHLGTTPTKDKR
jgi:hypothetical protein